MEIAVLAFEAVPKALLYTGLLLAVGAAVVGRLWASASDRIDLARVRRLARFAAWLTAAGVGLRLVGHSAAAFGAAEALSLERLRVMALESRWGGGWRVQLVAALAMVASSVFLRAASANGRSRHATSWTVFGVTAVLAGTAIPLMGHAAGAPVRWLVHTAHVLGAGAWLGTLGVLVALRLGGRSAPARAASSAATDWLIQRFTPVALTSAAVVTASGLVASWLYLGGFVPLVESDYGRTLLVKLALVAAVAVCGFANWQRSRTGRPARTSLLVTEALLAALVVAVTSVLTETEHP